jgi:hypothetical protein
MTTDNDQAIAEATETVETENASAIDKPAREVELETQIAELEQRAKSAEGRLKARDTSPTLQAEVSELRAEMRRDRRERQRSEADDADLTPMERQQTINRINEEERTDVERDRVYTYAERLASKINPRLAKVGLTQDNPKVQAALNKWNDAVSADDFDDVYDELDDLIEAERNSLIDKAHEEAQEIRQQYNQENNTLDVGATSAGIGQSGGMSDQGTWEAYGRGEIPWSKRVGDAAKTLGYIS